MEMKGFAPKINLFNKEDTQIFNMSILWSGKFPFLFI